MKNILILIFLNTFSSHAKIFKNNYVSFEIPEAWECKNFGTNWVCHKFYKNKFKNTALISTTVKVVDSNDTIDLYLTRFQQPKFLLSDFTISFLPKTWPKENRENTSQRGKRHSTEIQQATKTILNKITWVKNIHKGSEFKSHISHYLGTVCCKDNSFQLRILVILSAHKNYYKKQLQSFQKTINSLRVLDIEETIPKVKASEALGKKNEMAYYLKAFFDDSLVK